MSGPFALHFEGRTLKVSCAFDIPISPAALSEKIREVCAGPRLRMVFGGVSPYVHGLATTTYINTDESTDEISVRLQAMSPAPTSVRVQVVEEQEAHEIWASLRQRFLKMEPN